MIQVDRFINSPTVRRTDIKRIDPNEVKVHRAREILSLNSFEYSIT